MDAVVDERAANRFVVTVDGSTAELVYRQVGDRLVLVHTGVPDAIAGHGIAGRLTEAALARARDEGLTIVPDCPYARRWLEEHPEAAATVAIDWPGRLPGAGPGSEGS